MGADVPLCPVLEDGKWIAPKRKGFKLTCCDCGSVHIMDFKIKRDARGNRIMFRAVKDEKLTVLQRELKRTNTSD